MLKEKPTNLYGNVLLQRSYLSLTYVEKADVRKLHIGKQGLKSFETCSELYQISMRELMLEKKTTKSHVKTLHHKCLKVFEIDLCHTHIDRTAIERRGTILRSNNQPGNQCKDPAHLQNFTSCVQV